MEQKGKLNGFANILIIVGFFGWIGAFLLSLESVGTLPLLGKIELPPGPAQVIVDSQQRIYLISGFYRRIQLYDQKGEFVKGWHLSTHKGEHKYSIDNNNHLHIRVENVKDWTHYILDPDRGVKKPPKPEKKWVFPIMPQRIKGLTFEYKGWYLFPYVVKKDRSGKATTILRAPLWQWPITAPFPALALVVIGMVAILLAKRKKPS